MSSRFEIHLACIQQDAAARSEPLPWQEAKPAQRFVPFAVAHDDGLVWMRFDTDAGTMGRVDSAAEATVGLKIVPRRLGQDLALLPRRAGIRVNGLPAAPLQMLGTKDSLILAPGWLAYVTERVTPYVGLARKEHLGIKCPFCRIPMDEKTQVVTCRCGVVYHHETKLSHPDTPEADRLRCFEKIKACLSCNRPLTLAEHLVWDPESM